MSADQYRVLSSDRIFTGRVISLRTDELQMSDGSVSRREIVEHPGAVAVVALDPDDRVVLVRQYRHAIGAYLVELPAGLLDVANETALAGAKRELFEEAALEASEWSVLVDLLPSPGMSNEAIRVYLARGLSTIPAEQRFVPEHEEITMTVDRVPLNDAVASAMSGELQNATAVAGVLAAAVARSAGWAGLRAADSEWPARPGR